VGGEGSEREGESGGDGGGERRWKGLGGRGEGGGWGGEEGRADRWDQLR